ncbi:hypothetical protein [Microbacterium sp. SORGH_AS_0888]|uniref:hypothetical protein n=1 Tax=Microbacterium sp. SORGH_AS_0888 TaxID=3041791 RepID=UPI00278BA702|nr:hypothetical protein [Microbacterium sp. SORGH_AS_0888]MDQ1130236.1 hypothetical protein [Microbacterium sp. SORGH_AS_0888]
MGTRVRPAALDGHSLEAELSLDPETKAKVEVVVLDILRRIGPATDDQIVTIYHSRAEHYPGIPNVTEQRIRTARATAVRKGLVGANAVAGVSRHGNPATRWQLAINPHA